MISRRRRAVGHCMFDGDFEREAYFGLLLPWRTI